MSPWITTSAGLYAAASLQTRHHVGGRGVVAPMPCDEFVPVRVASGKVEQVDSGKGYEEAAKQRQGVDRVGGVEPAEEDEGGAKRGCGKRHVVEGVDAEGFATVSSLEKRAKGDCAGDEQERATDELYSHIGRERCQRLVEVIHLRENADRSQDDEDVGRRVGELIAAG